MFSLKGRHLYALGLILCTLELQYITAITPQSLHQLSPIIEQKQPPPPAPSSVIRQSIDTKAKLVGINRALHERLQQTRANLRPLQARAAQLQHRFDEYQRTAGARRPPSSGLAARGLAPSAINCSRKPIDFGPLSNESCRASVRWTSATEACERCSSRKRRALDCPGMARSGYRAADGVERAHLQEHHRPASAPDRVSG